jgi:hypothetical protein
MDMALLRRSFWQSVPTSREAVSKPELIMAQTLPAEEPAVQT